MTWSSTRAPPATASATARDHRLIRRCEIGAAGSAQRHGTAGDIIGKAGDRRAFLDRDAARGERVEMPAGARQRDATARLVGGGDDGGERRAEQRAGEKERRECGIGAGRREDDVGAAAVDAEEARQILAERLGGGIEGVVEAAAERGADQLLARALGGGKSALGDRGRGRGSEREGLGPRIGAAAIAVEPRLGIELKPGIAARGQEVSERREELGEPLERDRAHRRSLSSTRARAGA